MRSDRLYTILKMNMDLVILVTSAASIIIFGGIGVYLVEHKYPGANITNLGDALWWAVVTISSVGYGDYYPVTAVGRLIALFMMFSGIGIFVLLVSTFSQRRLHRTMSRHKAKAEAQPRLSVNEKQTAIKNKIEEIEKLTAELHRLLAEG